MSLILCIETSSQVCSVALMKEGIVFRHESRAVQNHAAILPSLIQTCLTESDTAIKQLNAVAISDGPGSYTGLRIGASTAKGICFALGIPLIAVSTLKSLAFGVMQVRKEYQGNIWSMIDARRMEVYHALFDQNLNQLSQIESGILDTPEFQVLLSEREIILCGDGAKKASEYLNLPMVDVLPHASLLCSLAESLYDEKQFADLVSYQPCYLKTANITFSSKSN